MPTTRERLQAAAGAGAPAAPGPGEPAVVPALALAAPEAEPLTTRDRIVASGRAAAEVEPVPAEPAAAPAVVVDLAQARERRRERRPEPAAEPRGPGAPLAPVITLVPAPELARPPPPAPRAETDRERAVPVEGAARAALPEAEAGATPEAEEGAAPGAGGAPAATAAAAPGAPAVPAAEAEGAGEEAAPAPEAEAEPAAPEGAPVEPGAVEGAAAPAAAPAAGRNPEDDPAFQALERRTRGAAGRAAAHQPASEGAATAQGASAPDPQRDVQSQAAGEQVETMGAQEPGPFDAAEFKRKVKAAIEGMAPPATLEEADDFEESGKAGGAATAIQGIVQSGKASSEHDIKAETEAAPDPAGKEPKPVTEMVNDSPGPPLPGVAAASALPGPRPPEETDLSAGPREIDAKMAEGNLTDEQLTDSNERDFTAVLDAREEVREHAAAAPGEYRAQEEVVLSTSRGEAEGAAASRLEGMHGARAGTLAGVLGAKNATKTADQEVREEIQGAIVAIHERAQADVMAILGTLDTTVESTFADGEKAARERFESYVDRKMRAYKADRYGGVFGGARWLKDKLFDLPDEVNAFYRDGRAQYLADMDAVIDQIATIVGTQLGAAQLRIQQGRDEVRTFVEGLPLATRSLGEETAADLDNRFDQLTSDVEAKRDELVDIVARKYVESRDQLDERIKELQEANKGLVSKAIDAIAGVLKTIYELGKLLLRVLLKAAAAIGDIIAHPIRFLGNLVGAVKGGLERFVSRIWDHLQKSLLDLLFGELGSAGITMPKALDFAGILDLVLQVLGLTYGSIRERVVKRFGEPVVARMEQGVDVFQTLLRDGVGGLWTWIREKVADLEDLVVGKIKAYVVERVVRAGIGYIVALLNPAAAFIKACQGIYTIVMFIVERAKQIAEFVESILDSIAAIAQGNVGAAVEKVEGALARGLTLAIQFLARLANLGALSEKVRSIIGLVRKPITRAVDQVVFGAAEVYRRTLGPALAFAKAKVQSGKDLLKGKPQAEKDALKKAPEPAEAAVVAEADPAAAPAAAPLAAEAPLAIHETFAIGGHVHELYTGTDGKQLVLSSDRPTPITAVPDPANELQSLNAQYLAARTRYESALAAAAANPRARAVTSARRQVDAIVDRMVAHLRQLRPDDSPGISAPGLGRVGTHGSKPSSLRDGPEVHWLESEHVIPFATGKRLWQMVDLVVPGRGRHEDDGQTTIMIYYEAARLKTPADNALSESFEAALERGEVHKRLVAARLKADEGDEGAVELAEDLVARMMQGLRVAKDDAVARTGEAIRGENLLRMHGSPQTNGERRGPSGAPERPLPTAADVASAAESQYDNVSNLVEQEVTAATILGGGGRMRRDRRTQPVRP